MVSLYMDVLNKAFKVFKEKREGLNV